MSPKNRVVNAKINNDIQKQLQDNNQNSVN